MGIGLLFGKPGNCYKDSFHGFRCRVPVRVPFFQGAVLFGDLERDPNLENCHLRADYSELSPLIIGRDL